MSTPSDDGSDLGSQYTGPAKSEDDGENNGLDREDFLSDFHPPPPQPSDMAAACETTSHNGRDIQAEDSEADAEETRLLRLFSNTSPAPLPQDSGMRESGWAVPDHFRAHWKRVPELLRSIPISMQAWQMQGLTPRPDDVGRMYSESKCFSILSQNSVERLAAPHHGPTYCFLSECYSDIPDPSLKSVFFMDNVKKILESQNRYPYVFPSDSVGINFCRKNDKMITGLYAKHERDPEQGGQQELTHQKGSLIQRLLDERTLEDPEESRLPVPEIVIRLAFTRAEYLNTKGQQCYKNFSMVFVTPAANFCLWTYIFEYILCPPKQGTPNYQAQMELYLTMKGVLEEILNNELVVNLGVQHKEFGSWDDYRFNSGGRLGVNTILSQFMLPAKIFHVIANSDPGASRIRIAGFPEELNFDEENMATADYIRYMHRCITATERWQQRAGDILNTFNKLKDMSSADDAVLEAVGGWPLQVDRQGVVEIFGLPPLPLVMSYTSKNALFRVYDTWLAYIGGKDALPELVSALLRSCAADDDTELGFPNIDHFLTDKRAADEIKRYQKYFSSTVNPFKSLLISNSQLNVYEGFLLEMQRRRLSGVSVEQVLTNVENYISSAIFSLRGKVASGGFRSKAIEQMLFICDTKNIPEIGRLGHCSIYHRLRRFRVKISAKRRYDRIDCAMGALLEMYEEMNRSFYLNSANLALLFELSISRMLYSMGGINDTWTYFFAMIMVMSGNGHYKVNAQCGTIIDDNRKPNGVGTDNVNSRDTDVFNTIYDSGIPVSSRVLLMMACSRFSGIVWEQLSTASAAPSTSSDSLDVFSQPPSELNCRPMYLSEMRGDDWNGILKSALARNVVWDSSAFTTTDPKKTNERQLTVKAKVQQVYLMETCSNVLNTKLTAEQTLTARVVSDVMWPGSGLPSSSSKRLRVEKRAREFQDFTRDVNTGRHRELEDKESVANFVVFPQIFAGLYAGTANKVRATPAEISDGVRALLEWATEYLKRYFEGMLNRVELENWDRMVQGYTSRGVALGVYIKSIDHLSRLEDNDQQTDVIRGFLLDLAVDCLPLVCVPYVLTRIMARSLHMGCVVMLMAIADDMDIPIVSWKALNRFFEEDDPPADGDECLEEYVMIRNFFVECINKRRFAPEDDGSEWHSSENISCYISGDGKDDMSPLNENQGYLRLSPLSKGERAAQGPTERPTDDSLLLSRVARRFVKSKGRDMFKTCHMGPELISYKLAFEDLQKNFSVDLRRLASYKMFFAQKHMEKMGLLQYVPGIKNYELLESPVFARQVTFRYGGQVKSEGLAFNPWGMLAVVSLAGQILVHPHSNDTLAAGIVTQILSKAPQGCTPGDVCRTRIFGHDSKAIRIFPSSENRPDHFLRPQDHSFPATGILPLARRIEQFLPEDIMHCPWLFALSKNLFCSITEIPSRAIQSPYYICPDKIYPAHNPDDDSIYATVEVITEMEKVEITEYTRGQEIGEESGDGKISQVPYDGWELCLKDKGLVMLPLVERGGVCITILDEAGESVIGLLLKFPDFRSQFNPITGCCQALFKSDNTVANVYYKDALKSIIPVGTEMWLNMEAIMQEEGREAQSRLGKFLYVRLMVPHIAVPVQGKVYVAAAYRASGRRHQNCPAESIVLEVNPWDLRMHLDAEEEAGTRVHWLD